MPASTTILNRNIWITSAIFGSIIALSGLLHGYFEILQGNKMIETMIIQSIGPQHQRWLNGEEAFTLLNNFLTTGIAAVFVSLVIIFWSIMFLDKTFGPPIFLLLYVALTLVGGGIAHILFFLPVWFYARMIRKEITWKRKNPDSWLNLLLMKGWMAFIVLGSILFIFALYFSVFGIKEATNEVIMAVVFTSLLLGLSAMLAAFFAAISKDIKRRGLS